MAPIKLFFCVLLFVVGNNASIIAEEEPRCSKYHFEEKVLEKLIRLELNVESSLKDMQRALDAVSERQNEIDKKINGSIEDVLKLMVDKLETVTEKVEANEQQLEELEKSVLEVGNDDARNNIVAFVARNPDSKLPQDAAIVFKTIVLNDDSGYNADTGKFTAPVSGMYMFSVQICSVKHNYTKYQLVTSNNRILGAAQQYEKEKDGMCSTMTTVAGLRAGDAVWAKCVSGGSEVVENSTEHWNMFVGVLIKEAP